MSNDNDGSCSSSSSSSRDIEEAHLSAVQARSMTYIDPKTGFTVFTELAHLTRGTCCGNKCRHCPFGWQMVKNNDNNKTAIGVQQQSSLSSASLHRPAKLSSGDMEAAKRLIVESTQSFPNGKDDSTSARDQQAQQEQSRQPSSSSAGSGGGGRKGGRLTTKNVPYTRNGDGGSSQLLTGERRSKADDAFEAMGTIDELTTVVGVVHAQLLESSLHSSSSATFDGTNTTSANDELYGDLPEWLLDVMSRLFDLGSHVAKPKKEIGDDFDPNGVGGGFAQIHIDQLEDWIDVMTEDLPELVSFILPTGAMAAAQLQVARTVCRRAERRVVALVNDGVSDPNGLRYLNRLSDFFFTAARWVNYKEKREEIQYRREFRGAKQRTRQPVSLSDKKSEENSKA